MRCVRLRPTTDTSSRHSPISYKREKPLCSTAPSKTSSEPARKEDDSTIITDQARRMLLPLASYRKIQQPGQLQRLLVARSGTRRSICLTKGCSLSPSESQANSTSPGQDWPAAISNVPD